jgi:hypothetical protein
MKVKDYFKEHKWIIPVAIAAGVLIITAIVIAVYSSGHFARGTKVNGIDVSGMSVKQLQKRIGEYSINVKERKIDEKSRDESFFEETIKGRDIGLAVGDAQPLYDILKDQGFIKFFAGDKKDYEISHTLSYDKDLLAKEVSALKGASATDGTEAVSASIAEYTEGKGYEIVSEQQGDILDEQATCEAIEKAVASLKESVDLSKEKAYKKPEFTSESDVLKDAVETLNRYVSTEITYKFGDDTVVLDGTRINKWIKIKKDNTVKLRRNKVEKFVQELHRKYDTVFTNRKFKTAYGDTVTVYGGDYGWWMNTVKETDKLVKLIQKGAVKERTPEYRQTAVSYGDKDYGDTYAEVDLSGQHVFVVKDGKVVLDTACVTGNESQGHATPAGTYGITYKQRNATLRGENYETPVSYWMPFNGGIGFHDAYWRSRFGGTLYRTGGSHGCVNLPPSSAKKIYSLVEQGTPVICYHRSGSSSKTTTDSSSKPSVTKKPTATKKPKLAKKPKAKKKPKLAKKPKAKKKPKLAKKPTTTKQPETTKKPETSEDEE